jgi:hypothetical protein
LVEQLIRNQQVISSSLIAGSKIPEENIDSDITDPPVASRRVTGG